MTRFERNQKRVDRYDALILKTAERMKDLKAKRKECAKEAEDERLTSRGKLLESFLTDAPHLSNEEITALLEKALGNRSASEKKNESAVPLNRLTENGKDDSTWTAPTTA